MILASSAVAAILRSEPDAAVFSNKIGESQVCRMSAANYVEAAILFEAGGDAVARRAFDEFFRLAGVVIEAVTIEQARIAREAYRDFGKGTGHPAKLNFGDCFAYALAKERDEPLLFKGSDFSETDIRPAISLASD